VFLINSLRISENGILFLVIQKQKKIGLMRLNISCKFIIWELEQQEKFSLRDVLMLPKARAAVYIYVQVI